MLDDQEQLEPLFAANESNWNSNACLNLGNPDIGYVHGFKKAADLAVEYVGLTGADQDYLVYPIVFGYRQYMELRLKGLLRDAALLLDAPDPSPRLLGQHRLGPIWAALKPLLDDIFPGDENELDLIGARVDEFDAVDPHSFSFRYATTKHRAPSLPGDLRHINLVRLRGIMGRIADDLDGADIGIGVYLENKAEQLAYRYADA